MILRSTTKKMEITESMKQYFTELIQPLATNTSINKMFEDFKSEMIEKI